MLAQLPLGWFDRIFRRVGPALPLLPFGMRALSVGTAPRDGAAIRSRRSDLSGPLALYVSQGVLRSFIYHLHFTGAKKPGPPTLPPSAPSPSTEARTARPWV